MTIRRTYIAKAAKFSGMSFRVCNKAIPSIIQVADPGIASVLENKLPECAIS